jgi:hypothetical protein
MARASTVTLLSLDRFAQLTGNNPVHFSGGKGETYFPDLNQCSDIFYQYMWQQQNNVSREEIALAIKQAEDEISAVLSYFPAPHWVEQEIRNYPQYFRPDAYQWGMSDVRGMPKSVQLTEGKFIEGGRRALDVVSLGANVVYTDADNDGFDETATITVPTSLTNKCQIHCYYAGKSGASDWEIRPPRNVTLTGGNVVFVFWSWQLFKPELLEAFPTTLNMTNENPYGVTPVDIEDASSYVVTVDIYREYTDTTSVSATFLWERAGLINADISLGGWCCASCGNTGCPACEFITQDGCIIVKDANGTNVVPTPASYNSDNAQWDFSYLFACRNPDLVKFWYRAGEQSQDYLQGRTCDPLSNFYAEAIAMLATSRVTRPFCTCNNSLTLTNEWQRDLSFTGSRQDGSYVVSPSDLDNPFGTKLGSVLAWKKIGRLTSALMTGAAV